MKGKGARFHGSRKITAKTLRQPGRYICAKCPNIRQAKSLCQTGIDPARCKIQIGMSANSRQTVLCQKPRGGTGKQTAQRVENDRMMADNELRAAARRFTHHIRRNIKGQNGAAHLLFPISGQKPGIIKAHRRGKRSPCIQKIIDSPNRCHSPALLSSASCSRRQQIVSRSEASLSCPMQRRPPTRFRKEEARASK